MLEIFGQRNGERVVRTVFSKLQAFITINQMRRDGVNDIRCDFNTLDKLP